MTKFGIFLPNANNGYIVSEAAPQYLPTYELQKSITLEAEKLDYDFALSMVKYRGFGGSTEFWDYYSETFTLMAALAESTEKIMLIATAGILSVHPQFAARMMAMIDDVSGGRIGLNIVTGGWKPEYTQFGAWPGDEYYTERYEHAAHYVHILKELWEQGSCSYESPLWSLDDCQAPMKPKNPIPLVNAGSSPAGRDFTARYCDFSFVFAGPDRLQQHVESLSDLAASHHRKVETLALFHIIPGKTDKHARDRVDEIVRRSDKQAIDRMVEIQMQNKASQGSAKYFREGVNNPAEDGNTIFMGFPVIYGSNDTIAQKIDEITESSGAEGFMFCFEDYIEGMRNFTDYIRPKITVN